ncbi:MAG: helix-turn-helix domain-containing protein [Thiobacillus sp.]
MSEISQASVGQILRDARDAQGVTLEDAATRLRLMHRQIEAMEADDFERLGQPVFARGFVRNYARLLGLAPEALLARMEGAPAEPALVNHVEPPLSRSWLTSPWLILLLLGVLLVVAVPVALYLWLNSGVEDSPTPPAPVTQTHSAPMAAPAATLPVAPPPAAIVVPAEPTTVQVESATADAPATPAIPAVTSVIHLEFGDESWVEIKDASGRTLHHQLNPAGSSVDIQGQPPFDVVIGNASQVRMTYNGRPIDLKPFIAVTVARFTLEE